MCKGYAGKSYIGHNIMIFGNCCIYNVFGVRSKIVHAYQFNCSCIILHGKCITIICTLLLIASPSNRCSIKPYHYCHSYANVYQVRSQGGGGVGGGGGGSRGSREPPFKNGEPPLFSSFLITIIIIALN